MEKLQKILLVVMIVSVGAFIFTICGEAGGKSKALGNIVDNGKANAVIVISEKSERSVKLAANELKEYIRKISGAELEITSKPVDDGRINIYVGRSKFTDNLGIKVDDLKYGAFNIKSGDGYLALVGFDKDFVSDWPYNKSSADLQRATEEWDKVTGEKWTIPTSQIYKQYNKALDLWQEDDRGSLNAAYEFIRMQGVRWYMPGELGEILPQKKTIPLPLISMVYHPRFPLRQMYFGHFAIAPEDDIKWQLRMGLNQVESVLGVGPVGHGSRNVHGRKEMKAEHPEYYIFIGGKREVDKKGGGLPCLSAEGFAQQNVKYVQKVFDTYGNSMVSVMPQDGYGTMCQCELCKGKGTADRGWFGCMSDYVWGYTERVASEVYKTHPDKKITCFAYGTYLLPPLKIEKFSPNVVFGIVQNRGQMTDPEKRKWMLGLRDEWFKKTSNKMIVWDHYLYSREKGVYNGFPVYYPHSIAEDMDSLDGKSYGDFIEVSFGKGLCMHAPVFNHLNCYVTARLYWEKDRCVDDILAEYYRDFYGPAAEEMKEFVNFSESNWLKMREDAELIGKAMEMFKRVEKAVGRGNTVYSKRVALLSEYFKPLEAAREKLLHGRDDTPLAKVKEVDVAGIKIDGKFDEKFWNDLPEYSFKNLLDGTAPDDKTTFKAAWSGRSLYLAIKCFDSDMDNLVITATENEDRNLYTGDSVELLLETQAHSYYQMGISPAGALVDLDRKGGGFNIRWDSNASVASQKEEDCWTVEMCLPVADEVQAEMDPFHDVAGSKPDLKRPFYFNLCRQRIRGEKRIFSAFSPTGKNGFHDTLKFAKMIVE